MLLLNIIIVFNTGSTKPKSMVENNKHKKDISFDGATQEKTHGLQVHVANIFSLF